MRFGRLRLRGFKSYADATLDLSSLSAACVSGDNGTGKSTLVVDAPLWALFGKRHADLDAVVGTGATHARVDLEVITDDARYLVARERKRGGTTGLSVKHYEDGEWKPVVAGADAAQTFIDEVILNGRGYRELIASVYMVQGNHSVLTKASQSDAKAIFMALLALDNWPRRAAYVSDLRREMQREHDLITARALTLKSAEPVTEDIGLMDAQLVALNEQIASRSSQLEAKSNELAIARKKSEDAVATMKRRAALQNQLSDLRMEHGSAQALVDNASPRFKSVSAAEAALSGYDTLAQLELEWEAEARKTAADQKLAQAALNEAQSRVSELATLMDATAGAGDTKCYTCGQTIKDDARDRVLHDLQEKQSAAASTWRECRDALDAATKAVADVEQRRPDYDRAEHDLLRHEVRTIRDIVAARNRIAEIDSMVKDLERQLLESEVAEDVTNIDTLLREYSVESAAVSNMRITASELGATIARLRERVTRYESDMAELESLESEAADIGAKLDVLKAAERAFGRDGIPSYLLETAVPQVEDRANELLSMMSGGSMSVSIATQRMTKTAGVKESLDIVVSDSTGVPRSFDTFSGGEAFRINFALRVALAELVAQRSGLKLSMLVIDEPEGLDASGRDALVEALAVVTSQFETIILVSHHSDLKDALPQSVLVSKSGGNSTVTVRS